MALKRAPDPVIGQRFHRLTVKGQLDRRRWLCICDCGRESIAHKQHLLDNKHKSCGCLQEGVASRNGTVHGLSKTPLHRIWCNIKSRTTNPKVNCYPRYGGRGIRMCDEWFNSFEAFAKGVGERPLGMTLDRINNDGHYEPGNVRWVPHRVNCRNRSRKTVVTAFGRTLQLFEWTQITGVESELIRNRIKNQRWPPEDTVATLSNCTRFTLLPDSDPRKVEVLKRLAT